MIVVLRMPRAVVSRPSNTGASNGVPMAMPRPSRETAVNG